MDKETKDFIYFFLLPGVIVGMSFTVLNQILPAKFNVWIGLLVSLTFSVAVKAWTEIKATRSTLSILRNELTGRAIVLPSYDELMLQAKNLVFNPENKNATVFVYKGYPLSMEREGDYFNATINAINQGQIAEYHRIMSIRDADEAQSVVEVLKVLSKAEKASSKIKFYANFRPAANYISFITIDDDECIFALPNLAAAPTSIVGHRCGLHVRDQLIVHSLHEIFHQIRLEKATEPINIPAADTPDEEWENLKTELVNRVTEFGEPNTVTQPHE